MTVRLRSPRLTRSLRAIAAAGLAATVLLPGAASARANDADAAGRHHEPVFPKVVPLPRGFQPEGIARDGLWLLSGSLVDGDIYRASLRTGEGAVLADAPAGRTALGMHVDRRHRLFVAGGPFGAAYVYDTRTGAALADYRLGAAGSSFVNDVAVAPGAVWFTDSFRPVLYKLALGRNGALPPSGSAAEEVTLTGPAADDLVPGQFNLNGIVATPDGRALIAVNSTTGGLYRISPRTGASERIDLGGATVVNGDGLVLEGRRLWVVQNAQNVLTLVELTPGLTRGRVAGSVTDDALRFPTTAVDFGPWLYAVNARFDVAPPPLGGTPPSPTVDFEIVRVRAKV